MPVEDIKETMTFPEALYMITKGWKVTKLEWNDETTYGCLVGNILTLHKGGRDYNWIVSHADIVGEDYKVIKEGAHNE